MSNAPISGETVLKGIFSGPICGLRLSSPSKSGFTNERGEFEYRRGEAVTFFIGGIVLGTAAGAPRVNLAQLVNSVDGKIDRLHGPTITNLARLVQSLDRQGNIETGVTIAPATHDLLGPMFVNWALSEADFATDPAICGIFEKLNAAPGVFTANQPRSLRSGAAARNELRRNIRGIIKATEVRIPMRDGSYVCADIFRPADNGEYPIIMSKGFYGKKFPSRMHLQRSGSRGQGSAGRSLFLGQPRWTAI